MPPKYERWVCITAWLFVFASTPAAADDPTVHLEYVRTPDASACPEEEAVRENVAARLGYDPFREGSPLTLRVEVDREGSTWSAVLQLIAGDQVLGENRTTRQSPRCADLMPELEIAMAIALDPVGLRELPQAEPAPVEEPVEAPVEEPEPEIVTPVVPPPAATPAVVEAKVPLQFRTGVVAHLSLLSAPAPAFGVAIWGGVRAPSWSVSLEGRVDLLATDSRAGGTVGASLLMLGFVPCFHRGVLMACIEVSGGVLRAEGIDFARAQRVSSPAWNAGGRIGVEIPLIGPLHLTAGVSVVANLVRTTLSTEEGDVLWTSSPASVRLFLGPSATF